jgi:hypothetical protein
MKIESLLTAFLLLGGATVLARMMTQGIEAALIVTAVEWSARRARALAASLRRHRFTE